MGSRQTPYKCSNCVGLILGLPGRQRYPAIITRRNVFLVSCKNYTRGILEKAGFMFISIKFFLQMNARSYSCLFLLFISVNLFSQGPLASEPSAKSAEKKLLVGNFEEALDEYLNLLLIDPLNLKYNYNVGVCYLNIHGNKTKAIPYLERVIHDPVHDPNAEYLLGRAYQYAYRFDEAKKVLMKFQENGKGKQENLAAVSQDIQYCSNAKELLKFPIDVNFVNLGAQVNSEYDDQYAFVPDDESFMLFNCNKPLVVSEKLESGDFPNSILISEVRDGEFQKAKVVGKPICNGNSGAELIGMSAKGDIILIYKRKDNLSGDIYISEKDEKGEFKKPELLDEHINSPYEEIAASISADGNTIYFASDRPGGFGGTDIYVSHKMPNGKWGKAANAGPAINTPLDEDFPNISPDGNVLYFSSKGHMSMGGYDIFKVKWNEAHSIWENAKNIGYPINTPDDDLNFRISRTERYGYISACKPKGSGNIDNYRVIFNKVEPEFTVLKGVVSNKNGNPLNYPDVLITVTNDKTKELIGTYLPHPVSGTYVIILPPGKYTLDVSLLNIRYFTSKLEIMDKVSYKSEIEMDLTLEIKE